MAKQIPVFGMIAVLFLMIFSFPANASGKHTKQEATRVSVAVVNAATGCLESETHSEVVLKLSHVIFDFATIAIRDNAEKKSDGIFLAVNSFIRNPFYAVPTALAP